MAGKATLTETKSIYVSGPMRGKPGLNKEAFEAVAKMLYDDGWSAHNPHEANAQNGFSDEELFQVYIRADINALLEADAICLLPGWRSSEGARLEVAVARALDLEFYVAWHNGNIWQYESTTPALQSVEGIDQEARRLVYGERAQTYGHPRGDFEKIGGLWSAILDTEVTPEQVALMMAALKLARLSSTPTHRDSQVDVVGYILCLARLQEDPVEIQAWENRDG